jgi:hypothetical protein
MSISELLLSTAQVDTADPMAALAIIVSTAIATGAVLMQFLTLMRHEGEEAVVSSYTWLLLASFAVAMGAFFWRQHGDYFLVLLMGVLASGAMATFILNLSKRDVIERVRETRETTSGSTPELDDAISTLRNKLKSAREARQAHYG